MNDKATAKIQAVLFDYGGVLAEEGFREGLMAIAEANGLSPAQFFETATEAVYDTGYLTGRAQESDYWEALRHRAGIKGTDGALRREILTRFVLRPWMLDLVRRFRGNGKTVAILSDQTDWLDELDRRDDFLKEFDLVFNSYYIGMGKRDPSVFTYVVERLGVPASGVLFIDDNQGHIQRAAARGLQTILYRDRESFMDEIARLRPIP